MAPGVVARAVLAWALATGVPVIGMALVGFGMLNGDTPPNGSTAWSVIVLALLALLVGLGAITAAARSIAEPIRSVRHGLAEVEQGNQDAEVPVYDASEVGLLQAGFDRMAAGLRERERLRDLFGRHVGEDVARQALEDGVKLGGELREAAVIFVDVIGSTELASRAEPQDVVGRLNAFFALVLDVDRGARRLDQQVRGRRRAVHLRRPRERRGSRGAGPRRGPPPWPSGWRGTLPSAPRSACPPGGSWRATSARRTGSSTRSSATR